MKSLTRFFIICTIAYLISHFLTSQFFVQGNWSFTLANFAVFVVVAEITQAILRWAFATKVADLYFEGKKVGTIEEEDK